jgi:hypothetical protein
MMTEMTDLREADFVELLPGTALPPGFRIPEGARGRIVVLDRETSGWVTVQFGRFRRPVCVPRGQVRRVDR